MNNNLTDIKDKIYSKYHDKKWFIKIDIYGSNELVIYYKNTKNMLPHGCGKGCRFYKFAEVHIRWIEIKT